MWTSYDYEHRARPEPDFYLPRILGGKLAVLVVLLVLYLCVDDQLARHLRPSVVNLGLAHAQASVTLAVFGDGDTIITFRYGHKYYDLTRHMVAHGHLFVACWKAVLWQIERGTILACVLISAPPVLWQVVLMLSDLWNPSLPQPRPAEPVQQWLPAYYVPAPPPPPVVPSSRADKAREKPHPAVHAGPIDADPSSGAEVRKRPRKAKKVSPPEEETTPVPLAPSCPIVEPGQVRKRRKPEV